MIRSIALPIGALILVLVLTAPLRAQVRDAEKPYLSDVRQLTTGFARAGEAYFSPDMQWIVFQAAPTGGQHYHMYLARVQWNDGAIDGIEPPIRISPEDSRNTCGHFSPDGSILMFSSTAGKEDPDEPTAGYQREGRDYRWAYPKGMEIFRAEGWQDAIAAVEPGGVIDLARSPITDNDAYDAEGSFSPDGRWIVFTSNRAGSVVPDDQPQADPATLNRDLELYAKRADGSGAAVRLTHAPGYDGGPFFSPDGKRIVYRSDRRGNNLLQIFVADVVYDADGDITGIENERQLTNDANVNWGPYWHPDGGHIIYATSAHGHTNYELYLMCDDGSDKTRITHSADADVLPVFSPDGKWLLWASKRNGETTQIYVGRFTLPGAP